MGGEGKGIKSCQQMEAVGGNRGTALKVEQGIVPSPAHLASEQSERVNPRAVLEKRVKLADIRAAKIGPVALAFNTPHPSAGLPAVTDLSAGDTASCIMTAFPKGRNWSETIVSKIPALVARSPAAVGADVEAAPVIDRSDHRGRRRPVTGGDVGGRAKNPHPTT